MQGMGESTKVRFDEQKRVGTIYHSVSGITGENILYLIDVTPRGNGSTVTLHAKGDLFRPTSELRENLKKWTKDEKGHCRARGEI